MIRIAGYVATNRPMLRMPTTMEHSNSLLPSGPPKMTPLCMS
ncbi:hypothetical protein [Bacillus rhizoplanae]